MKRRSTSGGTTLAELAAGIAFVAIALVGTIAAIGSGSALAKTTAETRAAERVAASLMEEIRATNVDDIVATFHGTSRTLDGVGHSSSGAADIVIQRIDNGATMWAVYEVTILVRWARAETPRAIELKALVSDRARGSGLATQQVQGTTP
jgi:hypothetical protein